MNRLPSSNGTPRPQVDIRLKLSHEASQLFGSVARECDWSEDTLQTLVQAIALTVCQVTCEVVAATQNHAVRDVADVIAHDVLEKVMAKIPQLTAQLPPVVNVELPSRLTVDIATMPEQPAKKVVYDYNRDGSVKNATIK